MSVSDNPGPREKDGVPQLLVLVSLESSTEFLEELEEYIHTLPSPLDECRVDWDTWKGVYMTPGVDSDPWTQDNVFFLMDTFKKYPSIVQVDISDGDGSVG